MFWEGESMFKQVFKWKKICFKSSPEDMFIDFRERGRDGERKKH